MPEFAKGGIATRPTLGIFGEAGPEALVPLDRAGGMGTTVTIAGVLDDRLFVVQVGDSRAYLVRDGHIEQLTKDQSLMQRLVEAGELTVEQAEVSERRNIILQALGPDVQVTVDLTHQPICRGDTLILCSDGLSGLVRAAEIARTSSDDPDMRTICTRLVECANERGGHDNITVIAVRFDGEALPASREGDRFGYTTFPLAGTLNDDVHDSVPASRPTLRSDPTPTFGTPVPSRAMLQEAFERAPATDEHARLGAPEPVIEARRRAAQPVFMLLGLIALLAVAWFVFELVD